MSEISEEVKQRHVVNAVDARAQASEDGYGFLRSEFRRAKPTQDYPEGEVFEIPHKDLFDLDQQERWDDLQDEMRDYEREPDVLAANGNLIAKGQLVYPHRWAKTSDKGKKGERVKPSWPERLAVVLWGTDGAARAKAGGVLFNEIELVWAKQRLALEERQKSDPKS
jgi:hypothetical protein